MLKPVLILAFATANITASGAYECPIGSADVLQVTSWSAERVDDQWTQTIATLQNTTSAEVLPVRIGRLFIEGPRSAEAAVAGMIVIERPIASRGETTITVQGTGLSYLTSVDQATTTLHACMQ